jgi:hypothetical protein
MPQLTQNSFERVSLGSNLMTRITKGDDSNRMCVKSKEGIYLSVLLIATKVREV